MSQRKNWLKQLANYLGYRQVQHQDPDVVNMEPHGLKHHDPDVETLGPEGVQTEPLVILERNPREFWPADKPLPAYLLKVRRLQQPCPNCLRVLMPDSGQAVVCTHSGREGEGAWFRCKSCNHKWSLPVRDAR